MPTEEQIQEYADRLPAIYRDVLSAYPAVAPNRRAHDGLTEETIESHVSGLQTGHRLEDVWDALPRLIRAGFLEKSHLGDLRPTSTGERLITAVTGHQPAGRGIPELPVPSWG